MIINRMQYSRFIISLISSFLVSVVYGQIALGPSKDETAPVVTGEYTVISPGTGYCRFTPSASYTISLSDCSSESFDIFLPGFSATINVSCQSVFNMTNASFFDQVTYLFFSGTMNPVTLHIQTTGSLPVELTSFTAESGRNGVELKWRIETETNNHGFEIERRELDQSADEQMDQWTQIGFVEGNGTTNTPQSYSFTDKSAHGKISYRLKQIDRDGKFMYSPTVEVSVTGTPKVFALEQNYPNPFNPSTTLGFSLQVPGLTTLKIYDALGREVSTLVNEQLEAGVYHQRTFDATHLSSGIYFIRLASSGKTLVRKMMLMK